MSKEKYANAVVDKKALEAHSRIPPEVTFRPKVTLKVESETCANCKFFVAERFCYLRPPVLSPIHGGSMRPRTEADDFCAEFKRKAE